MGVFLCVCYGLKLEIMKFPVFLKINIVTLCMCVSVNVVMLCM